MTSSNVLADRFKRPNDFSRGTATPNSTGSWGGARRDGPAQLPGCVEIEERRHHVGAQLERPQSILRETRWLVRYPNSLFSEACCEILHSRFGRGRGSFERRFGCLTRRSGKPPKAGPNMYGIRL
jgi:hypothetical protein